MKVEVLNPDKSGWAFILVPTATCGVFKAKKGKYYFAECGWLFWALRFEWLKRYDNDDNA